MTSKGIKIVHALPGRVRLKAARVKGNPALALLSDALGELFPEMEALELATRIISEAGEAAGLGVAPTAGRAGAVGALNARPGNLTGGIDIRLLLPLPLVYLGVRRWLTTKEAPCRPGMTTCGSVSAPSLC